MAVNMVVAVTDGDWFETLSSHPDLGEANFWAPSPASFRALQPGELFLFKLHAPRNVIVGGGIFAYATVLPWSLASQAFGEANGARNPQEMRARIAATGGPIPTAAQTSRLAAASSPSLSSSKSATGCRGDSKIV
jgi:putative restriction endonuclease